MNSKGETSDFSSIVHGTSLATPAINNIEITDTSATVFWYMGNVGIDSYAKNLVYEIHAFKGSEESVAKKICELYDAQEGSKCILALEEHLPLYGTRFCANLGKGPEEAAHSLFGLLREMDEQKVDAIFSEAVETEGIGLAVMNRLLRAAEFRYLGDTV